MRSAIIEPLVCRHVAGESMRQIDAWIGVATGSASIMITRKNKPRVRQ
jgi:hypothetical protein